MDTGYVETKVKDALKRSGGNITQARQQIILWAMKDHRLLQELTKAHLSGIVAYNIERVASGRAAAKKEIDESVIELSEPTNKEADFGMEILKAVADNNGAVFGFEPSTLKKRQTVSQAHVDALRMMAGKTQTKKS